VKKNSTLAYIVTIMMVFTLLAPVVIAPPVQAAGIPEIVDQMNEIIPYLDQADKDAIQAARVSLQGIPLNDAQWDTVLGVDTANNLLTSQVIAQFDGADDAAKTAAAREALINVAIGLGNIYYSQNATVLETDLTNFKETNKATFQKLFGTTTSVDDLYQLLQATRGQFGSVISVNGTYLDNLAFGSNATLVDTIPNVLDDAMQNVLNTNPAFTDFRGKLEAIGWSTTKLINQQKELGTIIDDSMAARLGLAKAMVRSETTLASGVPTTFAIDEVIPHTILIMGRDATDIVEWQSSSSVVEVTTDTQTGNYILTAKAPGTATLTNPAEASDWIFKYDVTVEGGTLLASGYVKLQLKNISGLTGGVTVSVINAQNETVNTAVVTADDGYFELSGISNGTYTVTIAANGYMTRSIPNVNITAGTAVVIANSGSPIELLAGNLNGDNFVNATDLSVLLASFNKTDQDQGYNSVANLNNDNAINASDLSILLGNFNKTCDSYSAWILP